MTIPFDLESNFLNANQLPKFGDLNKTGIIAMAASGLKNQTYVTNQDNRNVLPNSDPLSNKNTGFLASKTVLGELNTRVLTPVADQTVITNGDGELGNPTIGLSQTIKVPGTFQIQSSSIVNNISNSASSVSASDLMTAQAIQTAIGNAITTGKLYRGDWDASGNTFPTTGGTGDGGAIEAGNWWYISVAGTLAGQPVDPGDQIFARVDNPGQTGSNWAVINPRVHTVFGRTGEVVAVDNDYSYSQINGLPDSATDGKLMRGNGTTWTETTAQYPDAAGTSGNILTSDGTNWVSAAPASSTTSIGNIILNTGDFSGHDAFSFTDSYQEMSGMTTPYAVQGTPVDFEMTTDGQLKYIGTETKNFIATGCMCVQTSAQMAIYLYKNGLPIPGGEQYNNNGSYLRIENIQVQLSTNDYISLYAKRVSSANQNIYFLQVSASSY